MRTEKRTRNIRLRDLKIIYSQELKDRTFKAYEEDVSNGVVRQRELEEKVLMYYRRTTPSLQEYYSRYTPEWEAFYSSEHLPDMAFLQYLKQMRSAFKKRYELAELNIDYYISLLRMLLYGKEREPGPRSFFWINGISCLPAKSMTISTCI